MREAQECVELFLKGALRLVAVEPARTHDVAEVLRREVNRFPEWFRAAGSSESGARGAALRAPPLRIDLTCRTHSGAAGAGSESAASSTSRYPIRSRSSR